MARGFRGGFPGGGGGNMNQLMKQAQKMQRDLQKAQEEANEITATASSGGGMIKLTVNNEHQLTELEINPAVVDPDDIEMLQDLFIAAVNEAMKELDTKVEACMSKVTGGSGLGMMGL